MTGRRPLLGALVMIAVTSVPAAAQPPQTSSTHPDHFGFGEPAPEALIESIDFDVRPDGTGLPVGQGTAASGTQLYQERCASCHGRQGEGGTANPLVGTEPAGIPPFGPEYEAWRRGRRDTPMTIGNYWPYATTLFDYIRRAMPTPEPGSLSADDVYGLTAWLLAANGIIDDADVLNAETLPRVEMPARDLFVPDDRLDSTGVR